MGEVCGKVYRMVRKQTDSRQNIIIPKRERRILRFETLNSFDRVPFYQDPGTVQFRMLPDILIVQIVNGALGSDVVDLEVGGSDNMAFVRLA